MNSPLISMILHAGWAARIVLIILLVFSIITWFIIANRLYFIRSARSGNRKFRRNYDSLNRLTDLDKLDKHALGSPLGRLSHVALGEYRRIVADSGELTSSKEWSFLLQNQFSMAAERLDSAFTGLVPSFDRGVFLLAMVSSISPFLGLLGTVWGIMNSFFEIGNQGSASLPVVAPGIAEALVATLAGLAVAIPALFFYNYFNHRVERMETELDEFKTIMLVRLKREALEDIYNKKQVSA